ncbi:MAG: hypothetical protein NTZ48_06430, partial [Candidatus Omnitrophica bacterium]|nr:hypothetical protein [Candidatus Omnitrophota bacterium]
MSLEEKIDFIKDRFDPFTEEYAPNTITDEIAVIPGVSPFYIRTVEAVKQEIPSSIEIWSGSGKTGTQYTEVSAEPAAGEFQVDYKYGSGYIRFNEDDGGKTVYINYKGIGTLIKASDVNEILTYINELIIDPTKLSYGGVGDVLIISSDVTHTLPDYSQVYQKCKEIKIARGGALRIKWHIRRPNSGNVYTRVYRNGVAVGVEHPCTVPTGNEENFSE